MSETYQGTNEGRSASDPQDAWTRAQRTAGELGEDIAARASDLGRRLREARLEERVGDFIEQRPWTALAIALGVGAAVAAAAGTVRRRSRAASADQGNDLAEWEDALVAGSSRWADRGRDAVSRPASAAQATSGGATAGPSELDEWRPSDDDLSGEHNPLSEMGRGASVDPGAMAGRVTRDAWGKGMIE